MQRHNPDRLFMIIDPVTKEAYREGDEPETSGPLFFTTRELLAAYAEEEAIEEYVVHEIPGAILGRMRGKPHWIDGKPA